MAKFTAAILVCRAFREFVARAVRATIGAASAWSRGSEVELRKVCRTGGGSYFRPRQTGQLLAAFALALILGHQAQAQTYDWQAAWGPKFATGTELCVANLARLNASPPNYDYVYSFNSATPAGAPASAPPSGTQLTVDCDYTQLTVEPPSLAGQTADDNVNNGGISETIPGPLYWVLAGAPLAETCSANCVGDPINPAVGNVFTSEKDVQFAGNGTIAFRRFYNSADTTGADGVIGWRRSYDRSIVTVYQNLSPSYPGSSSTVSPQYTTQSAACTSGFAAIQASVSAWAAATATYNNGSCVIANGSVTIATLPIQVYPVLPPPTTVVEYDVIRDDGQTLRYTTQNGVVNNPPGISIRLAVTGSGFTVTDDDDNVEVYNAAGVLQSITSRAGLVQTISYDTNGRFYSAVDSFGNSVTVTRNSQNYIGSIAFNGGGTVQYGYDGIGRLSTVTNLDTTSRSYVYNDINFPYALTSIIDESGTTYANWGYDTQGRANSTQEALGANAQSLTYNPTGTVTVTDALGASRTFTYTRIGDINKVVAISGSQCPTCQDAAATTFDSAGWVSSRTDYNGNLTCYANDPVRGLELVRVEGFAPGNSCPSNLSTYTPASGTAQRKITTAWHATWREPVTITEANRTTGFTYDASGDVKTKTVTDTTVTPNVAWTWTYGYATFGRVHMIDGPRTDVTDTTTGIPTFFLTPS